MYFTVVDLANAFFSVPVEEKSQFWFAFDFDNKGYTFTRLCQGYCESPTIYNEALRRSLEPLILSSGTALLQYVDDLLICARDEVTCVADTVTLLNHLAREGHKVSLTKLQFVKQEITFLGHTITPNSKAISEKRIKAIKDVPRPITKKQLLSFLGMCAYCRTFIPNYSFLEKPLRALTTGKGLRSCDKIYWPTEAQEAFANMKLQLAQAPTLGLPVLEKPFTQMVDEKHGFMSSVLLQTHGDRLRPVTYFSTKLDAVAAGLPHCLRAVAAAELAVLASREFGGYSDLTLMVPHAVSMILQEQRTSHLSTARWLRYHTILLDMPNVMVKRCTTLNPATLLPTEEDGEEHHCCLSVLEQVCTPRPDLLDTPLENCDNVLFVDGSASKDPQTGLNKVGFAVTTEFEVVKSGKLPSNYSAQGDTGNARADAEAKAAAAQETKETTCALVSVTNPDISPCLQSMQTFSTEAEKQKWRSSGCSLQGGVWMSVDDIPCLPKHFFQHYAKLTHGLDHVSKGSMIMQMKELWFTKGFTAFAEMFCKRCVTCNTHNVARGIKTPLVSQPALAGPFEYLMMDFIELTPCGKQKHCLVMVDMWSKWVEAFPTLKQDSAAVAKALLTEIGPRWGIPRKISSDNGRHFVNDAIKQVGQFLGIDMRTHCSYAPSSGGAVERQNQTIKNKLAKCCEETGLTWLKALPIVLMYMRMRKRVKKNLSPFEILFGRPPFMGIEGGKQRLPSTDVCENDMLNYCKEMSCLLSNISVQVKAAQGKVAETFLHEVRPGDFVVIRDHRRKSWKLKRWLGPFHVLLVTHTAVKVAERATWVHVNHCRRVPPIAEAQQSLEEVQCECQ